MSHYIYKEKAFLEMPNGNILPLILYADSSVTGMSGRNHPAHWFIQTLGCEPGLVVDKKLYQKAADEAVQSRLDWLKEHYPDEDHSLDSYNPYGDTYRGNGKIRGMKSFLSAKRNISAEEYLRRNCFSVYLKPNNSENMSFYITDIDDIQRMDDWYRQYRKDYPDKMVYISVHGLPGED